MCFNKLLHISVIMKKKHFPIHTLFSLLYITVQITSWPYENDLLLHFIT